MEDHGRAPRLLCEWAARLRNGERARVDDVSGVVDEVAEDLDTGGVLRVRVLDAHGADHAGSRQQVDLARGGTRDHALEGVGRVAIPEDEDGPGSIVDLVDAAVLVLERLVLSDARDPAVDEITDLGRAVEKRVASECP